MLIISTGDSPVYVYVLGCEQCAFIAVFQERLSRSRETNTNVAKMGFIAIPHLCLLQCVKSQVDGADEHEDQDRLVLGMFQNAAWPAARGGCYGLAIW